VKSMALVTFILASVGVCGRDPVRATGVRERPSDALNRLGIGAGGLVLLTLKPSLGLLSSSVPLRKIVETRLDAVLKLFKAGADAPNPLDKVLSEANGLFPVEETHRGMITARGA